MAKRDQDPIVRALVPDPAAGPPNVAVLHGYFGDSTTPGHRRLYLTRTLDSYVDIPADQILHTSQLPNEGGSRVWVPKTLELHFVRTVSAEVQAGFLQGSIMRRHLRSSGAALAAAALRAQAGRLMRFERDPWETVFDCGHSEPDHGATCEECPE
jgi:hypothetical protein